MGTPEYIKRLLIPNGSKPKGRRVWSIDLETIWLPFFTATNVMGDTALDIPPEALGAPLRLAYEADGSVKFSPRNGKPITKVAKELQSAVRLIRESFVAGLVDYAHEVFTENPDGYKAAVEANIEAGKPIMERDRQARHNAITLMVDEAIEKADTSAQKPKAKAKGKEAVAVTA